MADFRAKKRIIVASLAALFVADFALFYFNSRLSTPASERQQALTAEARRLALVRADVDHANKVRATIPEILKDFDSFESTLLPASKGYSTISQDLDGYARESHVVLAG